MAKNGKSCLGKLGDVLADASHVEADDGVERFDVAVLELGEADVRDRADAELVGEFVALLNVAFDDCDLWVLGRELWELADEALARAAPWGIEVDDAEATCGFDLFLELVVRVLGHDVKVRWVIRHGNEVNIW